MLTQHEAISVASKELAKRGYVATEYDVKIETYDANENEWIVWFDLRRPLPVPGGKHAVLVDKRTGRTEFMPGE